MKKFSFTPLLLSISIISLSLIIGSCNLMEGNSLQYGSLSVATETASRTIEPTLEDLTITSYRVTGTGPNGETFVPVVSATSPITVDKLVEGFWSITIDGLNNSDQVVQTATKDVEIVATETTSATFMLEYPSGTGDFELTIEWPVNVTSVYSITGTISPADLIDDSYTAYASAAEVIDGKNTLVGTFTDIPTNSYALVVKFFDSDGNQIGFTMMDQINIYSNLMSIGTFSMPEYFFPVEAPSIYPYGGRINSGQAISLTTASTGDIAIYYTKDGSEPTTASNKYTTPFTLSSNKTVKAIAVRDDLIASSVSSATFEIPAVTPKFSVDEGTYSTPQIVDLSTITSGASIYYTTDESDPTTSETRFLYEGAITVSQNTTIKAIAVHAYYGDSEVASAEYLIRTATPTFDLREGAFGGSINVVLSSVVEEATIYYTTDGSEPTTSSTEYTGTISISSTTKLKAIAVEPKMTNSTVTSRTYTILASNSVADPIFTPVAGTYSETQTVAISTTTAGAVIYYTNDGTEPDQSSSVYSVPIDVSLSTTVKAYAVMPDQSLADSPTVTANYVILVATPTVDVDAGTYNDTFSLTLSCNTAGASIYYSTDESDPSKGGTLYSSPLSMNASTTVKAYATHEGIPDSEIATYTYTLQVSDPAFSVAGGLFTSTQSITLTSDTPDAEIYYTSDGSIPTSSSTPYSGTIDISATTTLKAIAMKGTMDSSNVQSETYNIGGNSGLQIIEEPHYSVNIITPPDWTGEPVVNNIYATILSSLKPSTDDQATYKWYFDGKEAKNNSGTTASETYKLLLGKLDSAVEVKNGLHEIRLEVLIGDRILSDQLFLRSSAVATIGITSGITKFETGGNSSYFLMDDDILFACGRNVSGQLGDGTNDSKSTPIQIMTNVATVSAGGSFTMILKKDGTLWATGRNGYGELGDGSLNNRMSPVKIMEEVNSVATGDNHTLILKDDNTLWATGYNEYGQLGDGTTIDRYSPVQVMTVCCTLKVPENVK